MATFAEHNFGNDGALQYLAVQIAKLMAVISEIMVDPQRMELEEDGESMLMPSVEILALLCERYNSRPPNAVVVQQWHHAYLTMYDRCIDSVTNDAAFKIARRKVIEQTFRWLESLAESYGEN